MATTKTAETAVDVNSFLNSFVADEQKKRDSVRLIELMREWSGFEAKMWGPTIIGFGSYHYRYASGHEGDSPLIGFSPRRAEFSLYISAPGQQTLLQGLGKVRAGKACLYFKRLSDLNLRVLEALAKATIRYISEHHECACRLPAPHDSGSTRTGSRQTGG